MIPIYFPFTYIPKPVVEAVKTCFRRIAVYQPLSQKVPEQMKAWEKQGILDLRVPVKKDEMKLAAACKEYMAWGALHQGNSIDFFKTQLDTIPFFDDLSSSKIRDDINKNIKPKPSLQKPDTLFNAGIFLCMAQELDRQRFEIDQNFNASKAMEKALYNGLQGNSAAAGNEFEEKNILLKNDPGDYMTAERMTAWTCLMQHDQEISGVYVTSSKAALDHLIGRIPMAEKIISIDSIPLLKKDENTGKWADSLIKQLDLITKNNRPVSIEGIAEVPVDKTCNKKISLTFYLAQGRTPHKVFHLKEKKVASSLKNTLIGLIEF